MDYHYPNEPVLSLKDMQKIRCKEEAFYKKVKENPHLYPNGHPDPAIVRAICMLPSKSPSQYRKKSKEQQSKKPIN